MQISFHIDHSSMFFEPFLKSKNACAFVKSSKRTLFHNACRCFVSLKIKLNKGLFCCGQVSADFRYLKTVFCRFWTYKKLNRSVDQRLCSIYCKQWVESWHHILRYMNFYNLNQRARYTARVICSDFKTESTRNWVIFIFSGQKPCTRIT